MNPSRQQPEQESVEDNPFASPLSSGEAEASSRYPISSLSRVLAFALLGYAAFAVFGLLYLWANPVVLFSWYVGVVVATLFAATELLRVGWAAETSFLMRFIFAACLTFFFAFSHGVPASALGFYFTRHQSDAEWTYNLLGHLAVWQVLFLGSVFAARWYVIR